MSLNSWKAEFYPVEASEVSKEDAIEHSLVKWRGLRKENRERHGLDVIGYWLTNGRESFCVNANTCALCEQFFDNSDYAFDNNLNCAVCPLTRSRGGFSCVDATPHEEDDPYSCWTDDNNPEPMIAALEKAKAEFGSKP